jgi:hypothetical protein
MQAVQPLHPLLVRLDLLFPADRRPHLRQRLPLLSGELLPSPPGAVVRSKGQAVQDSQIVVVDKHAVGDEAVEVVRLWGDLASAELADQGAKTIPLGDFKGGHQRHEVGGSQSLRDVGSTSADTEHGGHPDPCAYQFQATSDSHGRWPERRRQTATGSTALGASVEGVQCFQPIQARRRLPPASS